MINLGAPKFAYGPDQVNELILTLPPSPYTKSLGATGGDLEGDSGVRAAYVIRRDEFLNFQIRFYETEWPKITEWIDSVMDGQQFLFYPLALQEESYFVTLESPAVGTRYEPTPDGNYPRVLLLNIVLCAPNFDSPATAIREFQEDFETPHHTVVHASTTRRPDAVSFDYLRSAALGPIGLADVSQGSAIRKWYIRAFADTVYIARANPTNTAWEAEIPLFTYTSSVGDPILELDFAFTQAGTAVVCAERPSGLWLYWFDPTAPGNVFVNLGVGRSPKCLLDNLDASAPNTDVLVFYIQEEAGPEGQGAICYRVQSERYAIEHETPILGGMVLDVVSGDPDIHPLTGEGLNGTDGVETEGTFEITVPADFNTNGIIAPPVPHFEGDATHGDFMMADVGVSTYRLVFRFSKPVRNVSLSMFYPLDATPGAIFIAAVVDEDQFFGTGHAAYISADSESFHGSPSEPVGPYEASVTVNTGFEFLVIESPLRMSFGQSHYIASPTFTGSFDGNIGGTITLPPIEDMFVEDAVKTVDGRVMVIYSGRDEPHGTYMIQKLISGLYPFFPSAEGMDVEQFEGVSGELKIVLIIIEPPGTSATQYPDVFTDPAEDGSDIGNFVSTDGTLIDNTIIAIVPGETIPPGTPPSRTFYTDQDDDGTNIGQVTAISGALVANIFIVIPIGATPPTAGTYTALFYHDPATTNERLDINNFIFGADAAQELKTIVIVYVANVAFDLEGTDIGNFTAQSGTLGP